MARLLGEGERGCHRRFAPKIAWSDGSNQRFFLGERLRNSRGGTWSAGIAARCVQAHACMLETSMPDDLPPLNALRAFEAAGRHLSITKAASELHVTPAAVSHQVKSLEDYLGMPLFRRVGNALFLTDAGQACLPGLRAG